MADSVGGQEAFEAVSRLRSDAEKISTASLADNTSEQAAIMAKTSRFWLQGNLQGIINDRDYFREKHEDFLMATAFDFDHEMRTNLAAAGAQPPAFSYTEELARQLKIGFSPRA